MLTPTFDKIKAELCHPETNQLQPLTSVTPVARAFAFVILWLQGHLHDDSFSVGIPLGGINLQDSRPSSR
jgi:hypothetical protein